MTPDESDEIAAFLANIEQGDPGGPLDDPDSPRVVFPSVLKLTREQEDALVQKAQTWYQTLESELGRDRVQLNEYDYSRTANLSDLDYWFGRRRLYEMLYHKRVDWRRNLGGIFVKSNLHLPIVRRTVQQQIARATNYYFSTDPWFSASPQGPADEEKAQLINRYAQWKFRKAAVRTCFEKAIDGAMIRGESVVKTVSVRESRFYEDVMEIAIDPKTREPLYAMDGDYIQRSDKWIPLIGDDKKPVVSDKTGEPVMVLERDPRTEMPPHELTFETRTVKREKVLYSGPQAKNVYFLDFLCPQDAESVQTAPFIAHIYDMPATQIAQAYIARTQEAGKEDSAVPRIIDLLREAASITASEPAAAAGVRAEDGARTADWVPTIEHRAGRVPIAECYMTMDVNGDGNPEEIMLIINRETWQPIFYDYLDRVTIDGKRPFHVVRINPVDGRWYGVSQVDLYWDLQMFIDLTMNRWNHSQSEAGRITAWQPENCYEGDANPNLVMNSGRPYRLKPGKTIDDLIQIKYLNDIKGPDLQRQIEFFMQMAQNMSGVSNANDASMAGLDQTKLATGIKHLEKSGQELFAPLISHLEEGLESASASLLRLLVESMDGPETFQFFEGTVHHEEIRPDDLEGIDFIVEMELTRYKNEQQLHQSLSALDLVDRFYQEPPEKQQILLPIYRQLLKLFGIDNADRLLVIGLMLPGPGGGPPLDLANEAVESLPQRKAEPNL